MTPSIKTMTVAVALAALASCGDVTGSVSGGGMEVAQAGPPFITSFDPSVSNAAVSSCQSALDAQTDGAVSVVGSEFSQAATAIYMRVGTNGAPWRCLVSPDGSNPSLMFMGDEGAL